MSPSAHAPRPSNDVGWLQYGGGGAAAAPPTMGGGGGGLGFGGIGSTNGNTLLGAGSGPADPWLTSNPTAQPPLDPWLSKAQPMPADPWQSPNINSNGHQLGAVGAAAQPLITSDPWTGSGPGMGVIINFAVFMHFFCLLMKSHFIVATITDWSPTISQFGSG